MNFRFAPFSFSKINLFKKCPKAYQYKYLDGLPSMKWSHLEFGKQVHAAVEARFLGKPENPISVLDFDDQILAEEMIQKALDYIAFNDVVCLEQPLAVDKLMKPVEFDAPEALFRGKIDLLLHSPTTGYELVDMKTGYETPAIDQLLAYSFLLTNYFSPWCQGPVPTTGTYLMLREGNHVSWDIKPEMIEYFWLSLQELISIIESTTVFHPTPNDTCPFCDYIHRCPAAKSLHIPNAKTAKGVLSILHRAEIHSAYASRLKAFAREFVKATGATIEDDDRVFAPQTSTSLRIKSEEALEAALLQNGLSPDEYRTRSFDKDKLKELPGLPEIAGKAIALYQTTKIDWIKKEVESHVS